MGFWQKVRDSLKKTASKTPAKAPTENLQGPVLSDEELYLRALLSESVASEQIGDETFWASWNSLYGFSERAALELLTRFVESYPKAMDLRAKLAEILCERLELARAEPLLEALTAVPEHRLRAHFLLGESAERAGQPSRAQKHFEAILAFDLDYPMARQKADRLKPRRQQIEHGGVAAAAPTLAGLPDHGAELVGRYRLLRELGRGGAGAVYLAHDQELDRPLALKILHRSIRATPEAKLRAWNEARMAASIRHPGVVAVYDFDEERQIFAMEYCAGGTLQGKLRREKALTPTRRALEKMAELYATLHVLHTRGIVHGDCKPGNLLYRDEADHDNQGWVLSDFGLARLNDPEESKKNNEAARGTLAYMAPEQFRDSPLPASDVYACGIILLECLGDRLEWLGDPMSLFRRQQTGELRWQGQLPPTTDLSAENTAALKILVGELLHPLAQERPNAGRVAERLFKLAASC